MQQVCVHEVVDHYNYVAGTIADTIRRPRRRVVIPPGWGALAWVAETFPWLTDRMLTRFLK